MKKIYSFVLMAAMLFVGTNAWATINVPTDKNLKAAINDAADGEVIEIASGLVEVTVNATDDQIELNADKHIYLNLNNSMLKINNKTAAKNAGIKITRGILEITGNGTIENGNAAGETNYTSDLIRVYGTDETVLDPKDNDPYSQVIVHAGVTVQNMHYLNNAAKTTENPNGWNKDVKCNAISITEKPGSNPAYANGARVDVYGTLNASTYCVKVNGSIQVPDPKNMSPYVYIHNGATLTSDATKPNAVAAYSSGYGRWLIEGTCSGSTGLYCKGGTVEIANGSHILSQNTTVIVPKGQTSGVNAGGSAIVVESNASYPGDISVVITGGTVEATAGYAIEETITTAQSTEVDLITIQGGTIDGGSAGAIIVDNQTKDKVDVAGGNIDGQLTIQVAAQDKQTVTVEEFVNGTTTDPQTPNDEADYVVTKGGSTTNPTYTVEPNLTKVVTMNAYGFSTFSAVGKSREIKTTDTSLKAYITTDNNTQDNVLTITAITANNSGKIIIPLNTGVIFIGEPNKSYSLDSCSVAGVQSISAENNFLKPASAWTNNDPAQGIYTGDAKENVYVLSGNELLKYTGTKMKANKAYLQMAAPATPYGAPKRIQMVIAETEETQGIEDTEATVKAVKFFENGQVLIKRGETIYNVQGQIVK